MPTKHLGAVVIVDALWAIEPAFLSGYHIVGISLSVTVPKILVVEPYDRLTKTEICSQIGFFLFGIRS